MRIRVGHPGARMYYGIPQALQSIGALEKLYTDFTMNKGIPSLLRHLPLFQNIKNRYVPSVPSSQIVHMWDYGLMNRLRIRNARSEQEVDKANLKKGFELERLMMRDGLYGVDAVTMIGTSSQNIFRLARQKNITTISEQIIAPAGAYLKILDQYLIPYLEWEDIKITKSSLHFWQDVSYKEWENTDYLLCGSEFVKTSVTQMGFSASKAIVIPYGVPLKQVQGVQRSEYDGKRKLRVLFTGTVCIRKGIQYLLEIANELSSFCEIKICGAINLKQEITDRYKSYVSFEGHIDRDRLSSYYEWADVFVLPTLFEGSATVCYEAIQYQLPIITTLSSGIFLKNEEGITLIKEGSREELLSALVYYHLNPEVLQQRRYQLMESVDYSSLLRYQQRVQSFFNGIN